LKPSDDTSPTPPSDEPKRLPSATVAALFLHHADELRRFVYGVLRDHDLAGDVVQITFAKAIEKGQHAQDGSLKAWLFRVAFNEAIVVKRKQAVAQRANEAISQRGGREPPSPETNLVRWETIVGVRQALEELPPEQRQVVRMRMYENKKFIDIAAELKLPLGTVLTRMQLAVKKLKKALERDSDE